jgi:hypothetical protein
MPGERGGRWCAAIKRIKGEIVEQVEVYSSVPDLRWPAAESTNVTIPTQVDSSTLNDPADTVRKLEELRQTQQQTELISQQTEALRQQNEQNQAAQQPTRPPSLYPKEKTLAPATSTIFDLNGDAWIGFAAKERIICLQSMMEGVVSVGLTTNSMQQVHALFPDGLTPAQVAAELDDFYSPGSEVITIVDALRILAKE